MTKNFVNVGNANHESNANLISIPPHCYLMRQFKTPPSRQSLLLVEKGMSGKEETEPQSIQISPTWLLNQMFLQSKANMGVRELSQKCLIT
jgi:hypothetical protein